MGMINRSNYRKWKGENSMEKEEINNNEEIVSGKLVEKQDEEYVLIVLNDEKPLYFDTCEMHFNRNILKLDCFRHLGFSIDSAIASTDLLEQEGVPEFDFRYIAKADDLLQVYMFQSDIDKVYLENHGKCPIKIDFGTSVDILQPGPLAYRVPYERHGAIDGEDKIK